MGVFIFKVVDHHKVQIKLELQVSDQLNDIGWAGALHKWHRASKLKVLHKSTR